MMKRKILSAVCVILLFMLFLIAAPAAAEESFDASTMRLLKTSGDVQILDVTGVPRFVMENVRFDSGETLITGEDSLASVSLDDDKIVTLDALTKAGFLRDAEHMLLNLLEGTIFIDVFEKLDENASFDIQTTTMTVGIRGTLIFGRVIPGKNPGDPVKTVFGVLEGVGRLDYTDTQGTHRIQEINAGQIATLEDTPGGQGPSLAVGQMTAADIQGFVQEVVRADETLVERVTEATPDGAQLLLPPEDADLLPADRVNLYPADGSWTWNDPVQVVAQSASKLYDGEPLRRPDGALVSGLPESCSIAVSCSGAQTDAGSSANIVDSISIYNIDGEDITGHFTAIEKVEGTLRVDPAPLTIWTGSAEKVYDGEPLTCEEAGIRTVPGYISEDPEWRNTSIVSRTALGAETMVGVSGSVWIHGSNPVTGEDRELELKTGQRLLVGLGAEDDSDSIVFTVETLTVQDLPDDVLRLYADNPELLVQACEDAGWDPEELQERVNGLDPSETVTVLQNGLNIQPDSEGDVMTDSSNVRITMDSGYTSYAAQVLTETVAHFVPITLDPSIRVTATGKQEGPGESDNTYEIDWGNADRNNYTVTEDLGTLKVEPLNVAINCGGYSTTYDGRAFIPWPTLTYLNGPHAGESISSTRMAGALPARTVSDTHLRAASHTYHFVLFTGDTLDLVISGFGTAPGTYTLTGTVTSSSPNLAGISVSFSGARVVIEPAELTIVTGSAEKWDDGKPLASSEVTVYGLAEGDGITVKATGKQTGAGASPNTYEIDWGSVDPEYYTITEKLGTLTVKKPYSLEFSAPAKEKVYDGEPLTVRDEEISVTGLQEGDAITVYVENGEITDAGSVTPGFRIDWGSVEPAKYIVTENPGTLAVTKRSVTLTSGDASKTYDGSALTDSTVTVGGDGFADGEGATYNVTGSRTDAGSSPNSFTYTLSSNTKADNYDISIISGTLAVTKRSVTLTSGDASKTYDGSALTDSTVTVGGDGFADGEGAVYNITGSQTDADSSPNSFTYALSSNTSADNYDISTAAGTLTVTKRSVTLTSGDASKTYDGSALTNSTVTVGGDGFASGEGATYNVTGSQKDADSSPNSFTYALNSNTSADNYDISTAAGTLTVNKRSVTLTSGDASKTYDGSALTNSTVTVGGDGFASGEGATYNVAGSQKDADSSPNSFTYTLNSNTKRDNYTISTAEGTLTVTKRSVTLTSGDASKTYDGSALTNSTVTVGGDGFASGEGATYNVTGSQKDADSSPNSFTYTLNSNTKRDNYTISTAEGTLTVNKRNVTLISGDASKTFDGAPLTSSTVTVGGDGFAPGEGATYTTASRTEHGSGTNTITYNLNSNTKESNYIIAKNEGTLNIDRLKVEINVSYLNTCTVENLMSLEVKSSNNSFTWTRTTTGTLIVYVVWPWGDTYTVQFSQSGSSNTSCSPGDVMNYLGTGTSQRYVN